MRRAAAVILFILGGWILMTEVFMAWVDVGQTFLVQLGMIGICSVIAAVLLLLGVWASPGRKWNELGLTMMIAAGIGAATALTIFVMLSDPKFVSFMPSDRPVPHFRVALAVGLLNLAAVAVGGWLLYRRGRPSRTG